MILKITSNVQCMIIVCLVYIAQLQTQPFATETILISIDDSEPSQEGGQITRNGALRKHEELGASAIDLVTALYEEQCIIIVASSVVQYLMRYMQEVSSNPLDMHPAPKIRPDNWIKKKISDYLYLLIPKNYVYSRSNYTAVKSVSSTYTQEERAIGCIFNSKKEISDKDFMSVSYHKSNAQYPEKIIVEKTGSSEADVPVSWISDHFIKNLSTIFIPKKEYADSSDAPRIAVLLEGHGSKYTSIDDRIALLTSWKKIKSIEYDMRTEISRLQTLKNQGKQAYAAGQIAGLNNQDFARLIDFFSRTVPVTFLFISTCFGSSINLQTALQDIVLETSHTSSEVTVPFIMVSGSMASAVTNGGFQVGVIFEKKREIEYIKLPRYKKFLEALNKESETSDQRFFKALEYIYPFYQKYEHFNNIPVIHYPGKPWRTLEIPNSIVVITDTVLKKHKDIIDVSSLFLEKKRSHTSNTFHPPSITDYFVYTGSYPNILIFATADVPATLFFSDDKKIQFPFFLSEISGDALHHITKIMAPTYTLSDLLEAFLKIEDLQENKTFVIDQAIVKNNLAVIPDSIGKVMPFKHIVIINKAHHNTFKPSRKSIYFEAAGKEWAAENISMATPLSFALKEVHAGTVKNIISALPEGLKNYYPIILDTSYGSAKNLLNDTTMLESFADALKNIASKRS